MIKNKLLIPTFLTVNLFLMFISGAYAESSSATEFELYGGELNDTSVGIVESEDEMFVIAGNTYSFGAGNADFWLIKVDSSGTVEWNYTYGGAEADVATDMIQTSDSGYAMVGKTQSFGAGDNDFWLVKVDASGNVQWNKTYGQATAEVANSVIQTSDNGYVMTGYSTDANSTEDLWLIKTDSTGNIQWNKTYGELGSAEGYSVTQTSDGGYAIIGSTNSFSNYTFYDCWFIKTNAEGDVEWTKTYEQGGRDLLQFVIQTSDDGYTLAGYASRGIVDSSDIWVIHVDSDGNTEWNMTWAPSEPAIPSSMIQTNDEGYMVSGWTSSLNSFPGLSNYMFLIKIDTNGNIQWNSTYLGLGDSTALFVLQTDNGDYALTGTTKPTDDETEYKIWFATVNAHGDYIPEFPTGVILPLFVIATSAALFYKKRFSPKHQIDNKVQSS
ncbi:MAG: hypothetical protein NWF06_04325 [Candidatus Bathyarchaeota archaeon]|nr:hypothetical protein [Candidatus Bathyarchaeum sp.]